MAELAVCFLGGEISGKGTGQLAMGESIWGVGGGGRVRRQANIAGTRYVLSLFAPLHSHHCHWAMWLSVAHCLPFVVTSTTHPVAPIR